MSAHRRRYFGEQFELPVLQTGAVGTPRPTGVKRPTSLNEWDIIAELRARLRKAQAAQFKAEANLAIALEEKRKLQGKLQRIGEELRA